MLLCLADGLLNKQIAAALGLAENTVKVHVTAIHHPGRHAGCVPEAVRQWIDGQGTMQHQK